MPLEMITNVEIAEIVDESTLKLSDSNMPVRWCITEKTKRILKENDVKYPFLLISVVNNGREIERILKPLEQEWDFIPFKKPGENRIFATIVWAFKDEGKESTKKLKKFFMEKRSSTEYENEIFEHNCENFYSYFGHDCKRIEGEKQLDIYVDKEFFAPEPAEWEKWWVNFWHETPPRDQCQFKKRRISAYTIQALFIAIWLLGKTIATLFLTSIAFIRGVRGIESRYIFGNIFHPFTYSIVNLYHYAISNDSIFKRNKKGRKHHLIVRMIKPTVLICVFLVLIATGLFLPLPDIGLIKLLLAILAITVIGTLFLTTTSYITIKYGVLAFRWLFSIGGDATAAIKEKEREREKAKRKAEETARRREALAMYQRMLLCENAENLDAKRSSLPRRQQTFHLWLRDFKRTRCKPFAQ